MIQRGVDVHCSNGLDAWRMSLVLMVSPKGGSIWFYMLGPMVDGLVYNGSCLWLIDFLLMVQAYNELALMVQGLGWMSLILIVWDLCWMSFVLIIWDYGWMNLVLMVWVYGKMNLVLMVRANGRMNLALMVQDLWHGLGFNGFE